MADETKTEAKAEVPTPDLTVLRPILRMWNKNAAANLELQNLLKTFGFYTGNIDGDFGSKTFEAVKAAQRASNLPPDGVCGPKTWAALQKPPASPWPSVVLTPTVHGLSHHAEAAVE